MLSVNKYGVKIYYRYLSNLSVNEVLAKYKNIYQNKDMLITCLDSNRDITKLTLWINYLQKKQIEYFFVHSAIFIRNPYIELLVSGEKTFTHFDEIFFVNKDCPKQFSYSYIPFTTEIHRLDKDEINDELCLFFSEIRAETCISDGCGLNIVSQSPCIIKDVEYLAN